MVALTLIRSKGKLEGRIFKKVHERIIKNFTDKIIMTEVRNWSLSGYNVISYIHSKFNLLTSSGTFCSLLYVLQRKGLVEGVWEERKRVYRLTRNDNKTVNTLLADSDKSKGSMGCILKAQNTS
jgi:DNA-binding PadR family transcriptional regulator